MQGYLIPIEEILKVQKIPIMLKLNFLNYYKIVDFFQTEEHFYKIEEILPRLIELRINLNRTKL